MPRAAAGRRYGCSLCDKTMSRRADLGRHMRTHLPNKEELMYDCPYPDCTYRTLQHSNLTTHLNVHTGEKPNKCPAEGCDFETSDPGSLTRHRKAKHGYQTASSMNSSSTSSSARGRRQRRHEPYPTSSSAAIPSTTSPLDPSSSSQLPEISATTTSSFASPSSTITSLHLSPRFQLPVIPDTASAPSTPGETEGSPKDTMNNNIAAHEATVIGQLGPSSKSGNNPYTEPVHAVPFHSALSTTPEAPTVESLPLPMLEQGTLYAAEVSALAASTPPTYFYFDALMTSLLDELDDPSIFPAPMSSSLPELPTMYYSGNASLGNLTTTSYGHDSNCVPPLTASQLTGNNLTYDYTIPSNLPLLVAPEVPVVELPVLPMPEQMNFYAAETPALAASESTTYLEPSLTTSSLDDDINLNDYITLSPPVSNFLQDALATHYPGDGSPGNTMTTVGDDNYLNLESVPLVTDNSLAYDHLSGLLFTDPLLPVYSHPPEGMGGLYAETGGTGYYDVYDPPSTGLSRYQGY